MEAHMKENLPVLEIDDSNIHKIVDAVYSAVGDDILEDIQLSNLVTHNSIPTRIWDKLNTNLYVALKGSNFVTAITKRGPWGLVVAYDSQSGFLFTFMREQRYKQIRKDLRKRKKAHYLDALAGTFNSQLCALEGQISMFSDAKQYEDTETIQQIVNGLIHNLNVDSTVIQNHVLVLFDSSHFELNAIRAVMVDKNLDIVVEQEWSTYIAVEESAIVETVDNPNAPANNPTQNLKLTSRASNKASKRQNRTHIKKTEIEKENNS